MSSPDQAKEHGQNFIIRRNESLHSLRYKQQNHLNVGEVSSLLGPRTASYNSQISGSASDSMPVLLSPGESASGIRFQVVLWNVGKLDVVEARVPVTFRVSLFWNDLRSLKESKNDDTESTDSLRSGSRANRYEMKGRQSAVLKEDSQEATSRAIEVPPLSILNVVTFSTIGSAEVSLLREDVGLWRWTCMYRATLLQEHWRVDEFPHDQHAICLKLAVLAHRRRGQQWDRRVWRLTLATEDDSQGSTRIPYGLAVDGLTIPEFSYNGNLQFEFPPLDHGPAGGTLEEGAQERYVSVSLHVQRDSYYYDRNVVPLLGMLNFVAITITALGADEFFQRGLLTLNIAFVEISIRMSTDKFLPSVPYQIKLQRMLNEYFFGLLFLVVESNLVYELHRAGFRDKTWLIDALAACSVLTHNALSLYRYYAKPREDNQRLTYEFSFPLPSYLQFS